MAVRAAEMRLELHPFAASTSTTPPRCSLSGTRRSALPSRCCPAALRGASTRRATRSRSSGDGGRLGRGRAARTAVRRLPARRAAERPDLGPERLGRARRARGRGRRGCPRPLRRGRDALGRGGPHAPLRARRRRRRGARRAWFRLGFGQQHVARDPRGAAEVAELAGGVVIRRPTRAMSTPSPARLALPEHQARSPVFSPRRPRSRSTRVRAEWDEDFGDAEFGDLRRRRRRAGRRHRRSAARSSVSSAHTGLARPTGAGVPRLRGRRSRRPGAGCRPGARHERASTGRGSGLRDDRHRLAGDEPALLALLAAARLPPDLLPALPHDRLAPAAADGGCHASRSCPARGSPLVDVRRRRARSWLPPAALDPLRDVAARSARRSAIPLSGPPLDAISSTAAAG